jgi:hypothetical protein
MSRPTIENLDEEDEDVKAAKLLLFMKKLKNKLIGKL